VCPPGGTICSTSGELVWGEGTAVSAPLQRAPSRWVLPHRALTWLSALVLTLGFFTMGGYLPKAVAYEAATGVWTPGGLLTMPSGLTTTVTTSGSTVFNGVSTLGTRGFAAATYTPTNMVTGDSTMDILVNAGTCAATGTCAGLGTLTVTFSQPVRNPTLHLSGLGANVGNGTDQSDFHAYLDLTTSGVTMTQASSNGNMTVSGNRITAVNDSTSTTCTTNINAGNFLAAASTAACGSVKFNGSSQLRVAG
jgi:trimeric autotransporter adhesin